MVEFIDFAVSLSDQDQQEKQDDENEVSDSDLDSLKSFTDDTEVENETSFYRQFQNSSNSIDYI